MSFPDKGVPLWSVEERHLRRLDDGKQERDTSLRFVYPPEEEQVILEWNHKKLASWLYSSEPKSARPILLTSDENLVKN